MQVQLQGIRHEPVFLPDCCRPRQSAPLPGREDPVEKPVVVFVVREVEVDSLIPGKAVSIRFRRRQTSGTVAGFQNQEVMETAFRSVPGGPQTGGSGTDDDQFVFFDHRYFRCATGPNALTGWVWRCQIGVSTAQMVVVDPVLY